MIFVSSSQKTGLSKSGWMICLLTPMLLATEGDAPKPTLSTAKIAETQTSWCLSCHGMHEGNYQGAHFEEGLTCINCHTDALQIPHGGMLQKPLFRTTAIPGEGQTRHFTAATYACANCHAAIYENWLNDAHGSEIFLKANTAAPLCTDCHGEHEVKAEHNSTSPMNPVNIPGRCISCHDGVREQVAIDPETSEEMHYKSSPRQEYFGGVHWKALRLGDLNSAHCANCHTAHKVLNAQHGESSLSKDHRLETCAVQGCHPDANTNFTMASGHIIPSSEHRSLVFYTQWFFSLMMGLVFTALAAYLVMDIYTRFRRR